MAEVTYPIGYGKQTVTMAELERRYGPNAPIPAHPEYWKRIKAWLISRGGAIGIGGAYRFNQPSGSTFAPPGKSFHEKQRFASGIQAYSAIDLVVKNGSNVHRAPYWSEVPKQGSGHADIAKYGVHCNVGNEPWHIQCVEMDGWQSWVNAGRPDPGNKNISGGGTTPPATSYPTTPEQSLYKGNEGPRVVELQNILRFWGWGNPGNADGKFGPRTEDAVKEMQKFLKVGVDGRYGPVTRWYLQIFINEMYELANG